VNLEKVSLDTSVVLRLLVGVPADQAKVAKDFVTERIARNDSLNISDLVLSEAYFALQTFYKIPKSDALEMISLLSGRSGFNLSPNAVNVLALPNLSSAKPGFVDRLIHGASHGQGHTLVTFEKAAKKLSATHVLQV
jgi:predicted nucleic-acid-binding protein